MTSFGRIQDAVAHAQQISGASNPAWWSLGISILSLFVAAASLLWNIYEFKLSGRPAPEVKLDWLVNSPSPTNQGADDQWGYDPHVTVRIGNSGRAPVSVSNMFFSGGGTATLNGAKEGVSWPIVLKQGEEKLWHFSLRRVLQDLKLGRADLDKMSFMVHFGDGAHRRLNLPLQDLYRLIGEVTWHERQDTGDQGRKL